MTFITTAKDSVTRPTWNKRSRPERTASFFWAARQHTVWEALGRTSSEITAHLERYLRQSLPGRNVEVINAAITSDWTHHHLIYLNQAILSYQPDMVLLLDGFNDFFFFNESHDQFASYAFQERAQMIMGESTLYSLAYANGWWLFRKVHS